MEATHIKEIKEQAIRNMQKTRPFAGLFRSVVYCSNGIAIVNYYVTADDINNNKYSFDEIGDIEILKYAEISNSGLHH